jgi:hypothetical protein
MSETVETYLEIGSKRVFAGAVAWPGWCRSGRDEDSAIETLAAYGDRYAAAIHSAGAMFTVPDNLAAFKVVERMEGNATTDFGAPGVPGDVDERPLDATEADRLFGILQACWATFDAVAAAHADTPLKKGPRGGGREVAAIVEHVLGADAGYLAKLGGPWKRDENAPIDQETARVRSTIAEVWSLRASGEPPPRTPRAGSSFWPLRYFVRRTAWHVLDHAWEVEDKALT